MSEPPRRSVSAPRSVPRPGLRRAAVGVGVVAALVAATVALGPAWVRPPGPVAGTTGTLGAGLLGPSAGSPGADRSGHPPVGAPTSGWATQAGSAATEDAEALRALDALLARRSRAVMHHDRAAWLATVDPSATAFRARQGRVFDHLEDVPFASWTYEYLGRAPDLSSARQQALGGVAWVAHLQAGYRLRGFDTSTSTTEQYLTLVRRSGTWLVASDADGGTAPQPWDLGPVHVLRSGDVLLLGTAPVSRLRDLAGVARDGIAAVNQVWGAARWDGKAVLVVPRTQGEFGRLLLREADGLDQVAAVTTGDLREGAHRAGNDRVVVNPAAFDRLGDTGRHVVLTHELTHVAVRQSTTGPVPTWLSEGFADYVGYRGTGVTEQVGAGDLLALVRSGHGPRHLPTADDFDPTRTTIAPSYAASWLACSLVAQRHGTGRLVALYRRAADVDAATGSTGSAGTGGPPGSGERSGEQAVQDRLAAALREVLHTSVAGFTRDWLRHLDELAA